MQILVVFAIALACVSALTEEQYRDEFNLFKKSFNKEYATVEYEAERFGVFKANLDFINQHNNEYEQGLWKFTTGVNQFADLTIGEFKDMYLSTFNRTRPYNPVKIEGAAPPSSVDWRTKGAVTPIKNQGQCGSCWSFSTTGSVEGIHQISSGTLVSLSEQQLVDCSTAEGNQGCNGGLMDYAFEYIIKNGGIDTESDYPYTAQDGTCNKAKAAIHAASISGYQDVTHDDESALQTAAANQPVSVAIEADQSAFQLYKSGVFDKPCGTALDHGVLVVGYGTSTADYWIVKNSWGATWGDQGYIYMQRGVGKTGICGIAMEPSYPTVSSTNVETNPTDYGNPSGGCRPDEESVQVTGVAGDFCSPACSAKKPCPTDLPPNTTAKPECILEKAGASSATNCALVCQPSSSNQCPSGATCKSVSVIGICTYGA